MARVGQTIAPPADFRPLLGLPGTAFFSLQKGETGELQLTSLPEGLIVDLGPELSDFRDTAAVIQALDLVITVDTSVAHLAGGLGTLTWLLLPHIPDFRWMPDRDDSPWYPSMRLFRQPLPGEWESVFRAVRHALEERLATPRDHSPAPNATPTDAAIVTLQSATRLPDGRQASRTSRKSSNRSNVPTWTVPARGAEALAAMSWPEQIGRLLDVLAPLR